MSKDFTAVAQSVVDGASLLKDAVPDAMAAFGALGKAAYGDGALSPKTKELIALAIAVAARCEGCVGYHARAAYKKGASRAEVAEVLAVAIQMGGGPSMVYGAEVLRAYDEFAASGV